MKKLNNGFSLIELMLILGIVILISSSIFFYYNKVKSNNEVVQESTILANISAGIKQVYGGKTNYTGLNNLVLINSGVANEKSVTNYVTGTMQNMWHGPIIISTASLLGLTNNFYNIQYNNVPSEACVKFILGSERLFSRIDVNLLVLKAYGTEGMPLDVGATALACSAGINTINFIGV